MRKKIVYIKKKPKNIDLTFYFNLAINTVFLFNPLIKRIGISIIYYVYYSMIIIINLVIFYNFVKNNFETYLITHLGN